MKVLVTGSSGFIGTNLVKFLRKKGIKVITTLSSINKFDIKKRKDVLNLPKVEVVVHLAAIASVPLSWEKPKTVLETNIIGTLNILEYCGKHKAKIIYLNSYPYGGSCKLPSDEEEPVSGNNPYAVSKIAAEMLCRSFSSKDGFDGISFRAFNVYGPGQPNRLLISQLIGDLLSKSEITILSGKPKRDYVYTDDLSNAIYLGIIDKKRGFSIYNIGFGKSWSVLEIVQKLERLVGKDLPIIDKGLDRPNEIMDTVADISKVKKELGWKPKTDINEGLKKTYEWFKDWRNHSQLPAARIGK
jgi:nucleoside-diphosphate-sugar epimerase